MLPEFVFASGLEALAAIISPRRVRIVSQASSDFADRGMTFPFKRGEWAYLALGTRPISKPPDPPQSGYE